MLLSSTVKHWLTWRKRKVQRSTCRGSSWSLSFTFLFSLLCVPSFRVLMASASRCSPPDGGWGWVVVFGAFISIGFSYAFPKALTMYFKEIQRHFGVSYSQIAWVSSIMLAVMYAGGKWDFSIFYKHCRVFWADPNEYQCALNFTALEELIAWLLQDPGLDLYSARSVRSCTGPGRRPAFVGDEKEQKPHVCWVIPVSARCQEQESAGIGSIWKYGCAEVLFFEFFQSWSVLQVLKGLVLGRFSDRETLL